MGIEDRTNPQPCGVCKAPATSKFERTVIRQLMVTIDFKKKLETETIVECQCGNVKFGCITPITDTAVIESER